VPEDEGRGEEKKWRSEVVRGRNDPAVKQKKKSSQKQRYRMESSRVDCEDRAGKTRGGSHKQGLLETHWSDVNQKSQIKGPKEGAYRRMAERRRPRKR